MLNKHFALRLAAVLLFFSVVFASCEYANQVESVGVQKKTYSGEELFRAIIFMQGTASDEVPQLSEMKKQYFALNGNDKAAKLKGMSDKIVAQIQSSRPEFFNQLRSELSSNNQVAVGQAVKQAKEAFVTALRQLPEYNKPQKAGEVLSAERSICLILPMPPITGIVIDVYIGSFYIIGEVAQNKEQTALSEEIMINQMTRAFAAVK